ncbi:MAG: hypothetical protein QM767_29265 [Anaeromyxobacter sp.]
MTAAALRAPILPAPYAAPPRPEGLAPGAATLALVEAQVRALLESSPAYHEVAPEVRAQLDRDLVKIAGYSAELVREELYQSLRLGQEPVLLQRTTVEGPGLPGKAPPPAAHAAAAPPTAPARRPRPSRPAARAQEQFNPDAANAVGRVTGETLRAISFPTFVADLIRGTFQAIVNASIQQMEAYGALLANVSRTVDQFMAENISDNQAREWLVQRYPDHLQLRREGTQATVAPRDDAGERPPPDFRGDLGLADEVGLDESAIEEQLVPAARRKLARSRHQLLATMVLMGINRIVITGGKIRATMGFHIDTTDRLAQQRATDLDTRVAAAGSFGFGPWSASLSASVAYVSSERSQRDSEMNVEADLTSEVDLRFKSDYFPLERFVDGAGINTIRNATAVPGSNNPSPDALTPGALPDANPPPRPRRERPARPPPGELRPIGTLPPAPAPPTAPTPVARPPQPEAAPTPPPPPEAAPAQPPVTGAPTEPPAPAQPPVTGAPAEPPAPATPPVTGAPAEPPAPATPPTGDAPAPPPTPATPPPGGDVAPAPVTASLWPAWPAGPHPSPRMAS